MNPNDKNANQKIFVLRARGTHQHATVYIHSSAPINRYLTTRTCLWVVAGRVQLAGEEFQADDGVNDDDEYDEQRNVQQWHHGSEDGVEHHL